MLRCGAFHVYKIYLHLITKCLFVWFQICSFHDSLKNKWVSDINRASQLIIQSRIIELITTCSDSPTQSCASQWIKRWRSSMKPLSVCRSLEMQRSRSLSLFQRFSAGFKQERKFPDSKSWTSSLATTSPRFLRCPENQNHGKNNLLQNYKMWTGSSLLYDINK